MVEPWVIERERTEHWDWGPPDKEVTQVRVAPQESGHVPSIAFDTLHFRTQQSTISRGRDWL